MRSSVRDGFVLAVDLDGVCGDYESAFRKCVARMLGVDASTLPPQRTWELYEAGWGIRDLDHFLALHKAAVIEMGMFRHMGVIPGAPESLQRLSDAGVWIRIVTHRLCVNFGHAVAISDTVNWLDDSGIPYRDLCLIGDKPAVGADLYLDDSPKQVTTLRASGSEVLVFDQLYNRDIDGPRARSWAEVEAYVLEMRDRKEALAA